MHAKWIKWCAVGALTAGIAMAGAAPASAASRAAGGLAITAPSEGEAAHTRRYIITLREQAAPMPSLLSRQQALLARIGRRADADVTLFTAVEALILDASLEERARLAADADVVAVDEDILLVPAGVSSQNIEYNTFFLSHSTQLIGAQALWTGGVRGNGWNVAILDSGARLNSLPLQSKVVGEACFSSTQGANIVSLCPGGATATTEPGSGAECPIEIDGCRHGSHMAHAAVGNSNGAGTSPGEIGVAADAGFLSIKVVSLHKSKSACEPAAAPCARIRSSDLLRGLQHVFDQRQSLNIAAVVTSMATGLYETNCGTTTAFARIVEKLNKAKIAVVAASGDAEKSDAISFPSCVQGVVSVGSSGKHHNPQIFTDTLPSTTNLAPFMHLVAPGDKVRTFFGNISGSSVGAAHVAGAFALLRSWKPNLTVEQIVEGLVCGGDYVTRAAPAPIKPRVNVARALEFIRNPKNMAAPPFVGEGRPVGWASPLGSWEIKNGRFKIVKFNPTATMAGFAWSMTATNICGSQFEVLAHLRRTEEGNVNYNTGIMLATEEPKFVDGDLLVSGYFFAFNQQSGTRLQLLRIDNFNMSKQAGEYEMLCDQQTTFNFGQNLNFYVKRQGGVVQVGLNGIGLCSLSDDTYNHFRTLYILAAHPVVAEGHSVIVNEIKIKNLGP
jgi:subtilisin family serine protease